MNRVYSLAAQTSKSADSRVSRPADPATSFARPIWKSAIQPVGKPALLSLPFLIVAMAGCKPSAETADSKKAEAPVSVRVGQPRRGDLIRSVSLPANVTANQQATLYSKVAGYLKTITVDKGDEVKQGQLLAEIEVPELLADFART